MDGSHAASGTDVESVAAAIKVLEKTGGSRLIPLPVTSFQRLSFIRRADLEREPFQPEAKLWG